jgi:hypothetical protein
MGEYHKFGAANPRFGTLGCVVDVYPVIARLDNGNKMEKRIDIHYFCSIQGWKK